MTTEMENLRKALELERDCDWDAAHTIVQSMESKRAYRIHAYLHRKEGDLDNASYWYARARETKPGYSLEQEWQELYESIVS